MFDVVIGSSERDREARVLLTATDGGAAQRIVDALNADRESWFQQSGKAYARLVDRDGTAPQPKAKRAPKAEKTEGGEG